MKGQNNDDSNDRKNVDHHNDERVHLETSDGARTIDTAVGSACTLVDSR